MHTSTPASVQRKARPVRPRTSRRAGCFWIELPCKERVCLVRQHPAQERSCIRQVERLPEYLDGRNPNLCPALLDEGLDAAPVDVLAKSGPSYRGCALQAEEKGG